MHQNKTIAPEQKSFVLKLVSGETLITESIHQLIKENQAVEYYIISKPLLIIEEPLEESFSLKHWCIYSDDECFTLNKNHIISSATGDSMITEIYYEALPEYYNNNDFSPKNQYRNN